MYQAGGKKKERPSAVVKNTEKFFLEKRNMLHNKIGPLIP
jgi:hypothetical protein